MAITLADGVQLRSGHLYIRNGRTPKLWRFICYQPLDDRVIFLEVGEKWIKNHRLAFKRKRSEVLRMIASGELEAAQETIRPDFMNARDDNELAKSFIDHDFLKWLTKRDTAFNTIAELVTPERLASTYDPETCNTLLREHALHTGVPLLNLQRTLFRFAWFGLDKNALIPLEALKGRTDGSPKEFTSKTGAPNSAMRLGHGDEYEGVNVTTRDVTIFKRALRVFHVGLNLSLAESYRRMKETMYRRRNQHGSVQILESKIPTFEQFEDWSHRLMSEGNLVALKLGHKDAHAVLTPAGRSTDLADRVGDVYDSDGTVLSIEIVTSFKLDGKHQTLQRPTVILVADRASGKIMGWHIHLGAENWKESYRLAYFLALTSKTRRLKRLNIDAPDAWPDEENIKCAAFFLDNGPGSSKDSEQGLLRLNSRLATAGPDNPPGKGLIEGMMRIAKLAVALEAGGYMRGGGARDKERRRVAKKYAVLTLYQLEQLLVKAIIKMNAEPNKFHLLTEQMFNDGLVGRASANEIFSWGVKKYGGIEHRRLTPQDVHRALLTHKRLQVTRKGARRLGSYFNSEALKDLFHKSRSPAEKKNLFVDFMWTDAMPEEMQWIQSDGRMDTVLRVGGDDRRFGHMSTTDIQLVHAVDKAEAVLRRAKRKGDTLTREQEEQLRDQLQGAPKKQRNQATPNIRHVTDLERRLQQAAFPQPSFDEEPPSDLEQEMLRAMGLSASQADSRSHDSAEFDEAADADEELEEDRSSGGGSEDEGEVDESEDEEDEADEESADVGPEGARDLDADADDVEDEGEDDVARDGGFKRAQADAPDVSLNREQPRTGERSPGLAKETRPHDVAARMGGETPERGRGGSPAARGATPSAQDNLPPTPPAPAPAVPPTAPKTRQMPVRGHAPGQASAADLLAKMLKGRKKSE